MNRIRRFNLAAASMVIVPGLTVQSEAGATEATKVGKSSQITTPDRLATERCATLVRELRGYQLPKGAVIVSDASSDPRTRAVAKAIDRAFDEAGFARPYGNGIGRYEVPGHRSADIVIDAGSNIPNHARSDLAGRFRKAGFSVDVATLPSTGAQGFAEIESHWIEVVVTRVTRAKV